MGFLKNLFKRKPGGTLIGNLVRGVVNNASGGMLGNGAMIITQQDADKRDLSDKDYIAKYQQTKDGVPVNPVGQNGSGVIQVQDPGPTYTGGPLLGNHSTNQPLQKPFMQKVKEFFQGKVGKIILGVTGIALLVFIVIKIRKGGKRRY